MSTTTGPNRRTVLCGLAAALAAPAALAACSSPGEFQPGTPTTTAAAPAPGGGTGVPLAQVPVGGGTILTVGERPILVVQPTAGFVGTFQLRVGVKQQGATFRGSPGTDPFDYQTIQVQVVPLTINATGVPSFRDVNATTSSAG